MGQVPLVYRKERYNVEIRECMEADLDEIDTFRELKVIDPTYNAQGFSNVHKGQKCT